MICLKTVKNRGEFINQHDGGESWKQVLYSNERSGAVDISIDKNNPRIIFASTWNIRRTPYSLESGGDGSGLMEIYRWWRYLDKYFRIMTGLT